MAKIIDMIKKSSTPSKSVEFTKMSEVSYRPWKIQVEGDFGSGKSHFVLSALNYLKTCGYKPADICMYIIDLDDGIIPLIQKGVVPEEYTDSINYSLCGNFEEVLGATDKAYEMLSKHPNPGGAWLIIENMGLAWEWTRDMFSKNIYKMPMRELMMQRREEAQSQHKANLPVFAQMTDYAVINPLHNDWAEKIKRCPFNFVWTCLLKPETYEKAGNQETIQLRGEGQKHNGARVDYIVRLQTQSNERVATLIKSRATTRTFPPVQDLTFELFVERLNKVREKEGHPPLTTPAPTEVRTLPTPEPAKKAEPVVEKKPESIKKKSEELAPESKEGDAW